MKKKEKVINQNYLEYIPVKNNAIQWEEDSKGTITLLVENTGFFNRAAQKLLAKPKVTQIHLDKLGSFVWPLIDGETDIIRLGEKVDEEFGHEAAPLYERLAKYFQILESSHFISFQKP